MRLEVLRFLSATNRRFGTSLFLLLFRRFVESSLRIHLLEVFFRRSTAELLPEKFLELPRREFGVAVVISLPKALKSPPRDTRVVHRMLWIAVPEVILHGAQIDACVRKVVAARVPQHMRVHIF